MENLVYFDARFLKSEDVFFVYFETGIEKARVSGRSVFFSISDALQRVQELLPSSIASSVSDAEFSSANVIRLLIYRNLHVGSEIEQNFVCPILITKWFWTE